MLAVYEYPQVQTVRAYAQTAECSLAVLRVVDITVDNLGSECRMLDALAEAGTTLVDSLLDMESRVSPSSPALDESGNIADTLEVVADAMRRRITACIEKRKTIGRDPALAETQRNLLHDAYEEHIGALSTAESVISALTGLLIGYELARESRSPLNNTFDSALELKKHIVAVVLKFNLPRRGVSKFRFLFGNLIKSMIAFCPTHATSPDLTVFLLHFTEVIFSFLLLRLTFRIRKTN